LRTSLPSPPEKIVWFDETENVAVGHRRENKEKENVARSTSLMKKKTIKGRVGEDA